MRVTYIGDSMKKIIEFTSDEAKLINHCIGSKGYYFSLNCIYLDAKKGKIVSMDGKKACIINKEIPKKYHGKMFNFPKITKTENLSLENFYNTKKIIWRANSATTKGRNKGKSRIFECVEIKGKYPEWDKHLTMGDKKQKAEANFQGLMIDTSFKYSMRVCDKLDIIESDVMSISQDNVGKLYFMPIKINDTDFHMTDY
jgi:hypothetical protein